MFVLPHYSLTLELQNTPFQSKNVIRTAEKAVSAPLFEISSLESNYFNGQFVTPVNKYLSIPKKPDHLIMLEFIDSTKKNKIYSAHKQNKSLCFVKYGNNISQSFNFKIYVHRILILLRFYYMRTCG